MSRDTCTGRDTRGRPWAGRVAPGVARTGMYMLAFSGNLIRIERVERNGRITAPLCKVVLLLERVWGENGYD